MRWPKSPPPVIYSLRARRSLAVFLGSVLALAAAVWVLWCLGTFGGVLPSWREKAAVALAWWLATGVACRFWRRQARGALAWNGQQWRWLDDARAPFDTGRLCAPPDVRGDWQHWLLLHVRWRAPSGLGPWRTVWLWLDDGDDRSAWHLLRCALYFNPRPDPGLPGS